MFRAPLFSDTTPRRRRRDAGALYRPPVGAGPPIIPPPIVFNFYPDEPRKRHAPGDETISAVFYQPPNNITLLVAGQAATFAVGTITAGIGPFPTGVVQLSAAGTVAYGLGPALPNQAGTFAVGVITNETTTNAAGVASTFVVGSVSVGTTGSLAVTLTGQTAASAVGALGSETTTALLGYGITPAVGAVSVTVNGGVVITLPGQPITSIAGTFGTAMEYFALASQTATFTAGFVGAGSRFGYATVVALSQTGIQGAVSVYPEGTFCFVTATYYNLVGVPFVPALVSYRVDDVASGANIVPWTSIVPSTSNQVTITSAQNTMISLTRDSEQHQVLFEITDNYDDVAYASVIFDVVRVAGA